MSAFGVQANFKIVDRHQRVNSVVHCLHRRLRRESGADVRLVGYDDEEKARVLEPLRCCCGVRKDAKFVEGGGRHRLAVTNQIGVDDAITIEEDGLHHLVAFFCSFGCDTRQCQTTAWNASACGVTRLSSTVGITTTQSPAFLV